MSLSGRGEGRFSSGTVLPRAPFVVARRWRVTYAPTSAQAPGTARQQPPRGDPDQHPRQDEEANLQHAHRMRALWLLLRHAKGAVHIPDAVRSRGSLFVAGLGAARRAELLDHSAVLSTLHRGDHDTRGTPLPPRLCGVHPPFRCGLLHPEPSPPSPHATDPPLPSPYCHAGAPRRQAQTPVVRRPSPPLPSPAPPAAPLMAGLKSKSSATPLRHRTGGSW
jgi:hypothetical protein